MDTKPDIQERDELLMKEALKIVSQVLQILIWQAETGSVCGEVPVGAVFVLFDKEDETKYEIIAKAHNLTTQLSDVTKNFQFFNLGNKTL